MFQKSHLRLKQRGLAAGAAVILMLAASAHGSPSAGHFSSVLAGFPAVLVTAPDSLSTLQAKFGSQRSSKFRSANSDRARLAQTAKRASLRAKFDRGMGAGKGLGPNATRLRGRPQGGVNNRDPFDNDPRDVFDRDVRDAFDNDARDAFNDDPRDAFDEDPRDVFDDDARDAFDEDVPDPFDNNN